VGSIVSSKGSTERDIKHKAQQGQRTTHLHINLSLSSKKTIYKAVVEHILTYGTECWQMTEKTRRRIDCVKMDYLRRACRMSRREHMSNNKKLDKNTPEREGGPNEL